MDEFNKLVQQGANAVRIETELRSFITWLETLDKVTLNRRTLIIQLREILADWNAQNQKTGKDVQD